MLYLCPFFHANLQYAEFPPDAVPEMVESCYLPTLAYFASHPQLTAVFEYSGVTLEWMAERWPETIDLLSLLLERRQIELLGSTYANPILPLVPTDHARQHLLEFWNVYDRLFGQLTAPRPTGIFLQEFAYDPGLAPLLTAVGYDYTVLTPNILLAGLQRQLNSGLNPPPKGEAGLADCADQLLHPVTMRGAQGAQLTAFPLYRELIGAMFDTIYGRKPFAQLAALLEMAAAHSQERPSLLFFGPSDAEFVGAYARLGKESLSPEAVGDLLACLDELPFVSLALPRTYLAHYPPTTSVYVPAGSSERSIDIWTTDPDNARLNALCAEAAQKLRLATALGSERPSLLQQARRAMLLAENSDGRGWMPCPERRLACYDQALHAITLADEIIQHAMQKQPVLGALYRKHSDYEVKNNAQTLPT
ncbi:MAG: hypothetical protein H6659_13235 [Ardenticatenaceae bacterium]|nr:hypothetical protein [Ardenticatenaceae bacterium]